MHSLYCQNYKPISWPCFCRFWSFASEIVILVFCVRHFPVLLIFCCFCTFTASFFIRFFPFFSFWLCQHPPPMAHQSVHLVDIAELNQSLLFSHLTCNLHKILPKTQQSSSRRRERRLWCGGGKPCGKLGAKWGGNLQLGTKWSSGAGPGTKDQGPRVLANTQPLTVACEFILFLYVYFTFAHTRICIENVFRAFPLQSGKKYVCCLLFVRLQNFRFSCAIQKI